jgi:glycogen debranching enzyme
LEAGVGCISEIFDGDPPHRPNGCISQAWSAAGLIRLYTLLNEIPDS